MSLYRGLHDLFFKPTHDMMPEGAYISHQGLEHLAMDAAKAVIRQQHAEELDAKGVTSWLGRKWAGVGYFFGDELVAKEPDITRTAANAGQKKLLAGFNDAAGEQPVTEATWRGLMDAHSKVADYPHAITTLREDIDSGSPNMTQGAVAERTSGETGFRFNQYLLSSLSRDQIEAAVFSQAVAGRDIGSARGVADYVMNRADEGFYDNSFVARHKKGVAVAGGSAALLAAAGYALASLLGGDKPADMPPENGGLPVPVSIDGARPTATPTPPATPTPEPTATTPSTPTPTVAGIVPPVPTATNTPTATQQPAATATPYASPTPSPQPTSTSTPPPTAIAKPPASPTPALDAIVDLSLDEVALEGSGFTRQLLTGDNVVAKGKISITTQYPDAASGVMSAWLLRTPLMAASPIPASSTAFLSVILLLRRRWKKASLRLSGQASSR